MFSDTQHSGTAAAICVPNTGKISEEEAKLWENTSVPGQEDTFPRMSPGSWVTGTGSYVRSLHRPEPSARTSTPCERHSQTSMGKRPHLLLLQTVLASSAQRGSPERAESSLLGWGRRRGSGDFLNPRGRLQISLQS